ncbi:hypothetical protein OV450_1118 [Actinobacteria bacterium OV450]|nr:hypothetical protein OV450_1118 [Actinobacteria bacterium OV450]
MLGVSGRSDNAASPAVRHGFHAGAGPLRAAAAARSGPGCRGPPTDGSDVRRFTGGRAPAPEGRDQCVRHRLRIRLRNVRRVFRQQIVPDGQP